MRIIIFLITLAPVIPLGASAEVCSSANTFHVYFNNSIQDSIDAAKSGDTVIVHPGTYNENIQLKDGVDVYSSDGPDSTIIAGYSTWTRTVFADDLGLSTYFAGFTIEGGEGYGLYAYNCELFHVRDLVFNCDADTAALYDYHGGSSSRFENIVINGPSGARSGLEAGISRAEYDSITVRGIEKRGIYVWYGNGPSFSDITVDSCGTGIYLDWAETSTFDGGTVTDCTTGFEAYSQYPTTTTLDVRHIDVSGCTTGFSCSADTSIRVVNVAIDTCTVTDCTDGMILDRPSGHVMKTDFDDIDDIAITVTEGNRLTIGSDDSTEANTFNDVDGVGILADSGAVVTIENNIFDNVLGTAIEIETENDDTFVSYCDMDGTGGCYEGITTSGSGTMAEIRWCDIYDYDTHQTPEPRGMTVLGATAHLGQGIGDHGNNSFVTNAVDLAYHNRAATPATLYGEYNWWGEDPPDTNEFGGRKAYIDYDPWLTGAPRLLPVSEDLPELPSTTKLTGVYPNPGAGSVELKFWVPVDGNLEIRLYNLDGRLVRALYNGEVAAGPGSVLWDGFDEARNSCPSGVYLIYMNSNSGTDTGRFVLVR